MTSVQLLQESLWHFGDACQLTWHFHSFIHSEKCSFAFTSNKQAGIAVFIKAVDSLRLDNYTSPQKPNENTRFMDINIIILGFIVDLFELLFILQQIQWI